MKKRRTKTGLVLLLASLFLIFCETGTAFASQATSYTYTLDDNDDFVRTQDAYLPERTITDLGLTRRIFLSTRKTCYTLRIPATAGL